MENKPFTFHVHLPKGIEKIGQPVVLGGVKQLGVWRLPVVKLRQPFPENSTYWQSEQITIPSSNNINFKFAIHIPKSTIDKEDERIFEGNSPDDNRILDIERENQFAIWKDSFHLRSKSNLYIDKVQDYAFVDYIFNSIRSYNLNDKVMEYQHLLYLYNEFTILASNFEYIVNHIDNESKERRIFLCLLLGCHILRQDLNYELPKSFSSELLLDALDNYKQENLSSDIKVLMYASITTLIQHNALQYRFHWLKIFTIATEVDPKYTFIYRLSVLKYSNDDLLARFIEEAEIIIPHIKNVESEIYARIAKWLIKLCHNNDSLLKLWNDILLHNDAIDKIIFRFFIGQVQINISDDDAVALENYFKRIPKNYQNEISEVFRNHVLFLLGNPIRKWADRDISAIQKLLQDDSLNWQSDDIVLSLELISQSHSLELLNIFPDLLNNWFQNNFSDTTKIWLPNIYVNWFTLFLIKLGTSEKDKNQSNFIFLVFQKLDHIYPLLNHRKNIWKNLIAIAAERVKACSESQIIDAIKFVSQINEQEIKGLFSDIVKEIIDITLKQISDRLINKIFSICDCKSKILKVPNKISEDILCYILNKLERNLKVPSTSEQHLNMIKSSKFWICILNATGSVEKLNTNSYFRHIQMSIFELNRSLLDKTISIQTLQQLLKYSDKQLFQYFDEAIGGKKSLNDVIVSQDEIAKLRNLYHGYEQRLDQLLKFYNGFCSDSKVSDVNDFIQDLKVRMQTLDKVILNQSMSSDHWTLHEKTLDAARRYYKFNQSKIFRNIFEVRFQEDVAATSVEYIAKSLIPTVFEKYDTICKQFKEWEKIKCSDASLIWKNITDVDKEFDLMEGYKFSKNKKFLQALRNLSKISQWIERFKHLEKVVKIFKVPQNGNDGLSKSIRTLKDNVNSLVLGALSNFFDYFDKIDQNLSISQDCWDLIKELSIAEDFMSLLQIIGKLEIKGLINCTYLDEEDTISSLIQVKQLLFPLINKDKIETIDEFLKELQLVIEKDPALGKKIALCNNNSMTLQFMHNNSISSG